MTEDDKVEDLVLVMLRGIHTRLDTMIEDNREMRGRLGALERGQALGNTTIADISNRLDRVDLRLERLESRFTIVAV